MPNKKNHVARYLQIDPKKKSSSFFGVCLKFKSLPTPAPNNIPPPTPPPTTVTRKIEQPDCTMPSFSTSIGTVNGTGEGDSQPVAEIDVDRSFESEAHAVRIEEPPATEKFIHALRDEIEELKKNNTFLKAEAEKSDKVILEWEEKCYAAQKERDDLHAKYASLKEREGKYVDAEEERDSLQEKYATLQNEHKILQSKHDKLGKEYKRVQTIFDKWKKANQKFYDNRKKGNSSKSTSSSKRVKSTSIEAEVEAALLSKKKDTTTATELLASSRANRKRRRSGRG